MLTKRPKSASIKKSTTMIKKNSKDNDTSLLNNRTLEESRLENLISQGESLISQISLMSEEFDANKSLQNQILTDQVNIFFRI
jgi:hypothetical protein